MIERKVCGVVVTFRPKPEDIENLGKLRPQVQGLVVVDNGSPLDQRERLRSASVQWDFMLIENGANLGIAAALNVGIKWAQSEGFEWVALFDQDSTPPPGFIDTMLDFYDTNPRRDRIALLVPRYVDSRLGIPLPATHAADGSLQVAMTSGSLMPVSVFSREGWFEEFLFIDGVDYEYCFRLRSHGYLIEECADAVLLHAPADFTLVKFGGRSLFATSNYSAGRRYYRDRNKIWMTRKYWRKFPRFFIFTLSNSLKDCLKIIVAESQKWRKLYYIGLGIRDGIIGRMGYTVKL